MIPTEEPILASDKYHPTCNGPIAYPLPTYHTSKDIGT
jgi:hypothetical protein